MPAQALLIKGRGIEVFGLGNVVDGGGLLGRLGEMGAQPCPGSEIRRIEGRTMGRQTVAIAIQYEDAVIEQRAEGRVQGVPGWALEGPGELIKAQPKLLGMRLVMRLGEPFDSLLEGRPVVLIP
jgi:hypothetical protein